MKRLQILIYLFVLGTFINACSDKVLDEIDTNPNLLTDAPLNALLPQVITSYTHEVVGGYGAVYAGYMAEHTTHVLGANAYDKFDVFNVQPWEQSYLLMNDLNLLKDKATQKEAWAYAGIADVLKAYTLTTLVDLFGDVPYAEAFNADIRAPKFDKNEDLYPVIQNLLDEGIVNLEKSTGASGPSNDDLVFGGNTALWVKAAYGLKARIYNKLSNLDPEGSAQKTLEAIEKSFANKDENFMVNIFNESNQNGNPLSVWQRNQPESAVGNGIFNTMLAFTPNKIIEEDPRATIWFTTVNGERIPAPNGTAEADFGDPRMDGAIYSKPENLKYNEAPFPVLNYNELLFIKAEAHLRLGNATEAYDSYQEAVRLALEQAALFNPEMALPTEEIDSYLGYTSVSPGAGNLTMETIVKQKYIYFFQQHTIEAYNETRRTGFIEPTNPLGRGNRMLYANSEIARNPNTPSDITFFTVFEESTKLVWAK